MEVQKAKDKVIEEILKLYYQGYDGPFIGEDIEPLFKAISKLEKITGRIKKELDIE